MILKGSGALYNSYYAIYNCVFYYRFPDWGSDIERRGSGRLYGLYYDLKRQWEYYMTYIIVSMISLTATIVAVQFQLLLDHTK